MQEVQCSGSTFIVHKDRIPLPPLSAGEELSPKQNVRSGNQTPICQIMSNSDRFYFARKKTKTFAVSSNLKN